MSKVLKFGGASVKDAKAIRNMVSIVQSYDGPLFIVVSAIGKTTNALEKLWTAYIHREQDEVKKVLNDLYTFHKNIIDNLDGYGRQQILSGFKETYHQLERYLTKDPSDNIAFEYDQIVSYGELWSTNIVRGFLYYSGESAMNLDARKLIRTSDHYQEGRVDWDKTQELVLKEVEAAREFWRYDHRTTDKNLPKCLITQGFIGHTNTGMTTTLGREGSDFTAAILAWALDAQEVIIWKDVDGLLNADPKWFNKTQILKKISYKEAIELSYLGASVIHPNTVKPLENKNIPLSIRSFIKKDHEGSSISKVGKDDKSIPSIIYKPNQILLSISSKDYSFIFEEHISDIFSIFSKTGLKVHLMQNSALSFSVCGIIAPSVLPVLTSEIQKKYTLKYNEQVNLLTIRHFKNLDIPELFQNQEILIQQRSRSTLRYVLKEKKQKKPQKGLL